MSKQNFVDRFSTPNGDGTGLTTTADEQLARPSGRSEPEPTTTIAPDPFDPARLRLEQNFEAKAGVKNS